ncbi:prolyl aminopeptidase [Vibrio panuliri]|uniref:Proline iminopeptidase n=1 Tax=Vibrio panuliri TaxID=1381081 RepID=A0A1Q9HAV7_9VIBR|nr:prolyl aminopeptidase [Vibrio panuliri]OLQ86309.1 prolyl aminopeptidase [Vibrio panuliri]
MRTYYPAIEPNQIYYFQMPTSEGEVCHTIYVEESGNPNGVPVLFVHGGPGSGCSSNQRRFFNPLHYRIILFDQRGCGRSKPHGCIESNTTQHLIGDMDHIRQRLSIKQWIVFGGSWGATLSLAYAKVFPTAVIALILRGLFLARQQDIEWVYGNKGVAKFYPQAWAQLISCLDETEREDPLSSLWQKLNHPNLNVVVDTKLALERWECSLVKSDSSLDLKADCQQLRHNHAKRIQLYYCINHCFLDEMPLLQGLNVVKNVLTFVVHGENDMVCPSVQSWLFKQAVPQAHFTLVPLSGHLADEPLVLDHLISIMDSLVGES